MLNQPSSNTQFDLVLYGATGFVGQITATYLAQQLAETTVRWAIAGRNNDKLMTLKEKLNLPNLPIILANSNNQTSCDTLAKQTKVVISTVGPYALYGEPLLASCVNHGTDYVDLTGEVIWIKQMMDKYANTANNTGSRIVNCCGFDSIPSDLGVYFTQQQAQQAFGHHCQQIYMRVHKAKGGFSGGTAASMVNLFEQVKHSPRLRKQLLDPYLLIDTGKPSVKQPNMATPVLDANSQRWSTPFIMAGINTRVVHRSNYLCDFAYGTDFKYDEAMLTGKGIKGRLVAYGITVAMASFAIGASIHPIKQVLKKYVLPKTGTGPSEFEQETGCYDLRFYGTTNSGDNVITKVTGDKDPGYGSTSKMLGQAALCLLQDVPKNQVAGGFWSPAAIFGHQLIERLQQHAGLTFAVC